MKILGIISSCTGGDWPPLLALAVVLSGRGHEVQLVCDTDTARAVRAAGLAAICLPAEASLGTWYLPRLRQALAGDGEIRTENGNPLANWADAVLPRVRAALAGWHPHLVLGSLFCQYLAEQVAAAKGVRWCCLNPACFFGDRLHRLQKSDFSPVGAELYEHWLLPPLCRADLVLHATDPLFDPGPSDLADTHCYSGPLFWEMPGAVPAVFREPGPSWLLLSLSTAQQDGDLEIVRRVGEAMADGSFRVYATLAQEHMGCLGPLPGNIHISGYTPHSAILPHCRMVISHAGHGTVLKAMYYGKPMVLIPWGRDQPGVAARAAARGVAKVLDRRSFSAASLRLAIDSLVADPLVDHSVRAEAKRLMACNLLSKAIDRLEELSSTSRGPWGAGD